MRRIIGWMIMLTMAIGTQSLIAQSDAANDKYAVLVGVNDYIDLTQLQYTLNDIHDLKAELLNLGFAEEHIYTLTSDGRVSERPTKELIEKTLRFVLENVKRDDFLFLAFSGHGLEIGGENYFCPENASRDDWAGTCVSLSLVMKQLEKSPARFKMMVVDACRENPFLTRNLDPNVASIQSITDPPRGVAFLMSCAVGEVSHEDSALKHGVFTHYLIEGLRGKADADGDGAVTFLDLVKYTDNQTKNYVFRHFKAYQRPFMNLTTTDFVIAHNRERTLLRPIASPEDIQAAKKRIAALKGSVKTAADGTIISVKLVDRQIEAPAETITLDDMKLIGRLGDLESVSLEGAVFNDEMVACLAGCKKLVSVTINNAGIQDAAIEALATLPELAVLDIRRNLKLNDASLAILQKMPKLTELRAYYNDFSGAGMAKISNIPTLKIVDVRGCSDINDISAKYLAALPALEEVYFRSLITNQGVEYLTAAPKLRFIEFQDCDDINAGAVGAFQRMPSLKGLRIFRCQGFNDAALAGISRIPLERLELRGLGISNAGLASMVNCKTLKIVEFSELANVTSEGLYTVISGLKDLEKASFFSVMLHEQAIESLVIHSPGLKYLQLRQVNLTDDQMDTLLNLHELETLDLRENSNLSATALIKLSALKNLKTLYLNRTGIAASDAADQLNTLKRALPKCRVEK